MHCAIPLLQHPQCWVYRLIQKVINQKLQYKPLYMNHAQFQHHNRPSNAPLKLLTHYSSCKWVNLTPPFLLDYTFYLFKKLYHLHNCNLPKITLTCPFLYSNTSCFSSLEFLCEINISLFTCLTILTIRTFQTFLTTLLLKLLYH